MTAEIFVTVLLIGAATVRPLARTPPSKDPCETISEQDGSRGTRSRLTVSDLSGHSLLLPFDTSSPEFARGFESGRLWALLCERPEEIVVETAHAANAEMLIRMGEATGRPVCAELLDDVWIEVTFGLPDHVDSFA